MKTLKDIIELKEFYTTELYGSVKTEWATDLEYYNDTFSVPEVKAPHLALRTGLGRIMIDSAAEQIITSNPQAFVYTGNKEYSQKMNERANHWINIMRRMNPQPYKEAVKNKLLCGVNYVMVSHNEAWVTPLKDDKGKDLKDKEGKPIFNRTGLPIYFNILVPTVVYASPAEDENGVPESVIIFYERQFNEVIVRYPQWTNPKKKGDTKSGGKRRVEWFAYIDKDIRYFAADGEPVLKGKDGIQENIYGFVPVVRKYSGFGKRAADGDLASLIVSDIKFSRDLIREHTIEQSDIASRLHLTAHPSKTFKTSGDVNADNFRENYKLGAYNLNVLTNMPTDFEQMEGMDIKQPTVEEISHLNSIYNQIVQRNPFIVAGWPRGASGRQDDIAFMSAMKRYDTVIENTENEFATALEMGFRICKAVPTLAKAVGLSEEILDSEYKCEVKLKARDKLEEDRLSTRGDRLWNGGDGCIDLESNLVEFQGYTINQAKEKIANILADKLSLFSDDVAGILSMDFAEEASLENYLAKLQQKRMTIQQQSQSLMGQQSPTEQIKRRGEVQTERGRDEIDLSLGNKGARYSPVSYK